MRRSLARFIVPAVVSVLLVVVLAAAARPSSSPARWESDVVRVADTSGWGLTVVRAMEQWNAANVGVRFDLVGPGEPADVRVVADRARVRRYCDPRGCDAFASSVGPKDGRSDVVLDEPRTDQARWPTADDVRLVVHELGHTLGLEHERAPARCAVMLPDVALLGCDTRGGRTVEGGRPLCGPFAPDVRKASRLYGGPGVPREYCVAPLTR